MRDPTPLDRLDALEREATEGPWFDMLGLGNKVAVRTTGLNVQHMPATPEDVRLIALSRNHLRALIDVSKAAAEYVNAGTAMGDLHDAAVAYTDLCSALEPLLSPTDEKGTRP